MKKIVTILLSVILLCAIQVSAQKATVKGKPTVKDRFPKKSGNMMFSKSVVALQFVYDNQTKTDTVYFFNASKEKFSLELGLLPSHITAELSTDNIKSGDDGYVIIHYDGAKKKDYGIVLDRITLNTNDTLVPKKMIAVTASVEPYFAPMTPADSAKAPKAKLSETVFDYDTIKAGDTLSRAVQLVNEGESELKILSAKSNCACIKLTPLTKKTLAKGESIPLQISFNSVGMSGPDNHKIIIYTNSPFNSKVEVILKGVILKQ